MKGVRVLKIDILRMMTMRDSEFNFDEGILDLIAIKYDPMDILHILNMDTRDLAEALSDRILEDLYLFPEVESYD